MVILSATPCFADVDALEKQLITQGEVSKVDGVLKVNRLSIAQAKKGDPVARGGT